MNTSSYATNKDLSEQSSNTLVYALIAIALCGLNVALNMQFANRYAEEFNLAIPAELFAIGSTFSLPLLLIILTALMPRWRNLRASVLVFFWGACVVFLANLPSVFYLLSNSIKGQ